MFTLSSVSEIIGYSICHFGKRFGLKRRLAVYEALSSLACIAVAFLQFWFSNHQVDDQDIGRRLSLGLATFIGKILISAAFNMIYIYTSHFFPTRVRNTMLLFVLSIGRFGSLLSPFINFLGYFVHKELPYLIFSSFTLISCLFVVILPEPSIS